MGDLPFGGSAACPSWALRIRAVDDIPHCLSFGEWLLDETWASGGHRLMRRPASGTKSVLKP
jgi:hypothetical protein